MNLSVFETFFPEKRPFFIEDSRTLVPTVTPQVPMFHSRRIGQRPGRFAIPDERDGDRASGCHDDPWRHQGDRQGQRVDLRRPDGADRSRVRARGDGGWRARGAADRALHLLQRRARAERHSRRLVEHRRPRHGGAARERFRRLHRVVRLLTAMGQNKYTWNGQWSGTRCGDRRRDGRPVSAASRISTTTASTSASSGITTTSTTPSRTATSASFSAATTRPMSAAASTSSQPDPQKRFRSAELFANFNLTYNGDRLKLDDGLFHRRRDAVPELLEHVRGDRPLQASV